MEPCRKNVVEMLEHRGKLSHSDSAFTFFDGTDEAETLTFGELSAKVEALSEQLAARSAPGARAILAYGAGLDFVVAFFAAMRAGLVPVPVHSSRKLENFRRVEGIVRNCGAEMFLSNTDGLGRLQSLLLGSPVTKRCTLLATDRLVDSALGGSGGMFCRAQPIAFLQYTSGSTGNPKGVQVTHRGILANLEAIKHCFGVTAETVHVSWLPSYHDMGLIGSVLQPVFAGCHSYLMAPQTFLARPMKWLETISQLKATIAGGPNFAFDLCAAKASVAGVDGLDLSSWRVAYTGGEPVRTSTLERFDKAFRKVGFDKRAFLPCYGMAEATLLVAGRGSGSAPKSTVFGGSELVACGRTIEGHELIIVDENSLAVCPEGELGEIWFKGESVANGYWGCEESTAYAFSAFTSCGKGPYLRTGDLGYLKDGEIYPASRSKDMLIFDGENFFPQDIEQSVEISNSRLHRGGSCVFSVDVDDRERLTVISELSGAVSESAEDAGNVEIFNAVVMALRRVHGLEVHQIVLLRTGSLPRTSSGKLRRRATKLALEDGTLRVKTRWTNPYKDGDAVSTPGGAVGATAIPESAEEISAWMVEWVGANCGLDCSAVDVNRSFSAIKGMDSLAAVELAAALASQFGVSVNATMAWDHPTIEGLSQHLLGLIQNGENGRHAQPAIRPPDGSACRKDGLDVDDLDALLEACGSLSNAELEEILQGVIATTGE